MNMLHSIDDIIMTEDNSLSIDSTQFELQHENINLLPGIENSNTANSFHLNYNLLMTNEDMSEYNQHVIVTNVPDSPPTPNKQMKLVENTVRRSWTSNMVKALIEEYSELINDFKNPNCIQKHLWEEVASNMQMRGFIVNWPQCDKKWRNLKQTFRSIYEDETRDFGHKCRWEHYEDLLIVVSPDESEKQQKAKSNCDLSDEEFLIANNDSEISNDDCDLNITYDEAMNKPENNLILDYDTRKTALSTLIETTHTSPISNILMKAYLSADDSTSEQNKHQNIEFLVGDDGITEMAHPSNQPSSNQEQMPIWFKDFIEQYRSDENRRLEALQRMHNESLELEKKKVALLEKLLSKLT